MINGNTAVNYDLEQEPNENQLIEEAVSFIQEKLSESTFKSSIAIGNYILEKFFNNDIEYAKLNHPKKESSFRKLCSHPDLPMSASSLNRMMHVAYQDRFFIEHGIDTSKLSYTHLLHLIPLRNNRQKIVIINKIIEGNMSSKETMVFVKEYRDTITPDILKAIDKKQYKPWIYNPKESIDKARMLLSAETLRTIPFSRVELESLSVEKSTEIKETVQETLDVLRSLSTCYNEMLRYLDDKYGETD